MTTPVLPREVIALADEIRDHKRKEKEHRQQKRLKAAELEALCHHLGIEYRRVKHGTAHGHSQGQRDQDATA